MSNHTYYQQKFFQKRDNQTSVEASNLPVPEPDETDDVDDEINDDDFPPEIVWPHSKGIPLNDKKNSMGKVD
jgi:hypothetical protein